MVLGSIHTRMPSIASVKVGDVVYPVTLEKGVLYVMARLPVERTEPAFDYLLRETGDRQAALIPEHTAYEEGWKNGGTIFICNHGKGYYECAEELPPEIQRIEWIADRTPRPYLCHQAPFTCCSKTAASGGHGSSIHPRPLPKELLPTLRFGPSEARQKPLKFNSRGELTVVSLAGFVRKMSEETRKIFDALFEES